MAFHVARWDGTAWSRLGDGLGGYGDSVFALAVFDDGAGPALYAGGRFKFSGKSPLRNLAKWDGQRWSDVGGGVSGSLYCLLVSDFEGFPALYAGGYFSEAGGVPAGDVARWDGTSWASLGRLSGFSYVNALAVYDDGGGPALYAAGSFDAPAGNVARWDGRFWRTVGGGTSGRVNALATFDDGSGSALYAGGYFELPFPYLARWDGSAWTSAGEERFSDQVQALAVLAEEGRGPALYAAGGFRFPGRRIARWSGSSWGTLGEGLDGYASCLGSFDDGTGPALYVGGSFQGPEGAIASPYLARWADLCAARRGSVNAGAGPVTDVLFVNGSSGGAERRLRLGPADPVTITMGLPPSLGEAPFALYAWAAAATATSARELPFGIGIACRPMPLTELDPSLRIVWNNTGRRKLGLPNRPSSPAPSVVLELPGGIGRTGTVLIQGIIGDGASAATVRASATNGIEIVVN